MSVIKLGDITIEIRQEEFPVFRLKFSTIHVSNIVSLFSLPYKI
jgi:hypothetical protein